MLKRPTTVAQVMQWSQTQEEYGLNFRDWLHELKALSSKNQFLEAVKEQPRSLSAVFAEGNICDAYLAAYIEYICRLYGMTCPAWVKFAGLDIKDPWYSTYYGPMKKLLLQNAPEEFARRKVYAQPEITFKPHPGRPSKSLQHKRHMAILRQRAYRKRKRKELAFLRDFYKKAALGENS